MYKRLIPVMVCALGVCVVIQSANTPLVHIPSVPALYEKCGLHGQLSFEAFQQAVTGYSRYGTEKPVIAICDFTKPSTAIRFFVIDIAEGKLLLKSLVAHGKNSGELMATSFSNEPKSLKSSLGFFRIGEIIHSPKHGQALLLEGLQPGINDKAREREIIIHGADYVSETFIAEHGRLGRSFGCPALPREVMSQAANILCNGALLYVHADAR
ncbi:MAG: murein L,D-transpeptidase catalytic domain family protein [Chitinophagales bacterium]|nr:murein L,D-transpeptidase catalytic domain family protein [Chitinophagales bacterium]MDW8419528.1 murein L,D-transpeptidase catalytic domain family protein [Chitinophagales bacterium]